MGSDLGHRRWRRDRGVRDLAGRSAPARSSPPAATTSSSRRAPGAPISPSTITPGTSSRPSRRRPGRASRSSSRRSARPPGLVRSRPSHRPDGSTSAARRAGPNPPAALHRFWWKQLTVYGSSMGTRDDFLGAYDLVSHRPGPRARRHGVPARRDACRTRAARGRRPARQDRPLDPVGIHCLRRRGRHGDGRRSRSRHRLDKPPLDRLNGDSPNVQAKPTLRGVVEQPAGADTDTTCPAQWSGRGETKRGLRASGNRGRNHHDGRHPLVGRSSAERVRPPA